jgi:hypothetical protein
MDKVDMPDGRLEDHGQHGSGYGPGPTRSGPSLAV